MRTPEKHELKKLTNAWNFCITKDFMPRWLGGESISINDVCTQEYAEMVTKSEEVYANSPMPFAPATSLAEL